MLIERKNIVYIKKERKNTYLTKTIANVIVLDPGVVWGHIF